MGLLNKFNVRDAITYLPEFLLLVGGLFCLVGEWLGAATVNGIMVFGILAVVTLLLWRNKYLALAIAIILGIISVFLMLAIFAEYSEFPPGSSDAWRLLVGMLIFGPLFVIALIMPRKYFRQR